MDNYDIKSSSDQSLTDQSLSDQSSSSEQSESVPDQSLSVQSLSNQYESVSGSILPDPVLSTDDLGDDVIDLDAVGSGETGSGLGSGSEELLICDDSAMIFLDSAETDSSSDSVTGSAFCGEYSIEPPSGTQPLPVFTSSATSANFSFSTSSVDPLGNTNPSGNITHAVNQTDSTNQSDSSGKEVRGDSGHSYRGGLSVLFLLALGIGLILSPWVAEWMVYSIARGSERAKADIARQLLAGLPEPEQRIPWVVKKVAPSVVFIRAYSQQRRIGDFGVGIGTGVIVDSKNSASFILTNNHVISNAQRLSVQLSDGQSINDVEIVGYDEETDLAVLRINQSNLNVIDWGDSRVIDVGEQVVAIGNPFGLGHTVTSGIISATDRYNPNLSGSRDHEMLQTDAAINPGNSGGPLVNLKGELIGINTTIFSHSGGNQGIGFAIPSLLARHVYNEIREHGEVEHGWLGIIMMPTSGDFAKLQGWDVPKGVVVREFTQFSPAREAGIKRKDILIKWGDTEIRDPLHLSHLIVLSRAGKTETIELIRNGEIKKVQVKLGRRPVSIKP
ncbi:MAG: trypsin-like peptidase domain-containing protein [Planctomycetaceae bacterium]|jgi:S1-C subfamily serine protease|nr:trypsin-like peptidase domain-containing protein [Planctomycetaceae bacterium]